jgi:hypothetical protein
MFVRWNLMGCSEIHRSRLIAAVVMPDATADRIERSRSVRPVRARPQGQGGAASRRRPAHDHAEARDLVDVRDGRRFPAVRRDRELLCVRVQPHRLGSEGVRAQHLDAEDRPAAEILGYPAPNCWMAVWPSLPAYRGAVIRGWPFKRP